jgi:flagellar basal-body rod modification protein FlgD
MTTAIPGINNLASAAPPSTLTPTGSSALGKDQFLKLLLAQLANQDPTQPTDNQAFVAQLAQFSSLEAAQTTNSTLESLLMAAASANSASAANFIGKDVTYTSDQVAITSGSGGTIQATLAQSAASVTATITDATGKAIRTLTLSNVGAGTVSIPWDGKSTGGTQQPAGSYTVKLEALDGSKNTITINQQGTARVTGVSYASGTGAAQLIVNGLPISMTNVLAVKEPSSTATPTP